MRKFPFSAALAGLLSFHAAARAESYTLTLKEAIARALGQNADVAMARIDEMKANEGVTLAKAPFYPRIGVGSGMAYSTGFPLSIEGAAPAIFAAKVNRSLYNRPESLSIEQAKETAHGAGIALGERRDELVYRVASVYVDLERTGRLAESARKQVESLQNVVPAVDARVEAGRELPVARQEAKLNLLRARQRLLALETERDYASHNFASVLGYSATDTVVPAGEDRPQPAVPDSEEAALKAALEGSKELRRLESNYQAKVLEERGDRARRLPQVDLVAQYAMLTKYNYDQYFSKFERNNAEIGASIQVPIMVGPAVKALVAQAEADQQHIRAEIQAARNRIALEVHQSYQEIRKEAMAGEVAKAELDLAHEQLSVLLAQMNEGRATLKQVEEARFAEDERWIAFYDAQFSAEKARLNVLRQTGELAASLR